MSEHSLLTETTLREARNVIAAHGSILPCVKETYDSEEYPPSYVTALRCIDRMIPRPVVRETGSRKFQWEHSAYDEYQCPQCGAPLIALEDEVASDVIFHCQNCGQAVEWE